MTQTPEQLLTQLHRMVADELISRIQSGDATTGDISVAVKFLKDNQIDVGEKQQTSLRDLASIVPFKAAE
jgi:hypothetical protein